jgi:hypothetical protein
MTNSRIANDYYPTPDALTLALKSKIIITGTVFEPCAGHGAIAKHFPGCITNEPFPSGDFEPDYHLDATESGLWNMVDNARVGDYPEHSQPEDAGGIDWVVTNPPFGNLAMPILKHALPRAQIGVAMLLRITYLEPCKERAELLAGYADNLTHLIPVSPRPRFRADTKGSDSATVAWFVWQRGWSWQANEIDCPFNFLANWR